MLSQRPLFSVDNNHVTKTASQLPAQTTGQKILMRKKKCQGLLKFNVCVRVLKMKLKMKSLDKNNTQEHLGLDPQEQAETKEVGENPKALSSSSGH